MIQDFQVMSQAIKRVALLFSGGPAPGANSVISACAISFIRAGIEVVGIRYGYSNLIDYTPAQPLVEGVHYLRLTEPALRRTRSKEGILIGTARANPGKKIQSPADLQDRRCEITGPAERKMMISALNSGARVFMTDIEDSLSPRWTNVVDAQRNIRDVADRTITFERPDGTVDHLDERIATLVVRPRGLHMTERHVLADGRAAGEEEVARGRAEHADRGGRRARRCELMVAAARPRPGGVHA